MRINRRKFLKITGVATLGLIAKLKLDMLSKFDLIEALPEEKKALEAEQWGMVIDLGKCGDGCIDCIEACHKVHNVPAFDNPKDEIFWLRTIGFKEAFPEQAHEFTRKSLAHKPVLVLCNHCRNPQCVKVCPTQATWLREDGIVMMDMHRCIGCRYCMAACPYGSRSFNWRDPRPLIKEIDPEFPTRGKGVVEKCNFCAERLAIGKIPACVEACKEGALIFGDLEDPNSEVRKALESSYSTVRKPSLGTEPKVYYIIRGE
ncbi:MAG: sulfate reduction electron transfer complex DsrMKJOP subunit DsrO [Methanobacteriota archaeon]